MRVCVHQTVLYRVDPFMNEEKRLGHLFRDRLVGNGQNRIKQPVSLGLMAELGWYRTEVH